MVWVGTITVEQLSHLIDENNIAIYIFGREVWRQTEEEPEIPKKFLNKFVGGLQTIDEDNGLVAQYLRFDLLPTIQDHNEWC